MTNTVVNVNGSEIQIRPLVMGDISAIKNVIDSNELFPSDMLDDMVEPFLSRSTENDNWLVADNGSPIAVAYFTAERMTCGTWNLLLIAVHSDNQSMGVGAALMRHIENSLSARGERVLLVETSGLPEFVRTRAFYLREGYDEEARIRDFYKAGEDKIIFRRSLSV